VNCLYPCVRIVLQQSQEFFFWETCFWILTCSAVEQKTKVVLILCSLCYNLLVLIHFVIFSDIVATNKVCMCYVR